MKTKVTYKLKSVGREFIEFYEAAFRSSKRLTLFFTLLIPIAIVDEIHAFIRARGSLWAIWLFVKQIKDVALEIYKLLGG
jgi:hypothetical protein